MFKNSLAKISYVLQSSFNDWQISFLTPLLRDIPEQDEKSKTERIRMHPPSGHSDRDTSLSPPEDGLTRRLRVSMRADTYCAPFTDSSCLLMGSLPVYRLEGSESRRLSWRIFAARIHVGSATLLHYDSIRIQKERIPGGSGTQEHVAVVTAEIEIEVFDSA